MNIISVKPIMILFVSSMVLSACSTGDFFRKLKTNKAQNSEATVNQESDSQEIIVEVDKAKLRGDTEKNPRNLGKITVADASKVSDTELKAAAKPAVGTGQSLGKTIVSLGLLGETGFWLQTPLVTAETDGRIVNIKSGKTVNVRLIPNGAASGSGSQMSIAAMQLLGIAITDIVEVQVFTR